jgi:tape measure domain-containing protein
MAQDAELKLKVSLDLAFFRQQLAGLGSAAGGYSLPINLKFDRTSLTKELTRLSNSLSRKKYDVEVKSISLQTLLDKVEEFKKNLAALKKEDISLNVKVESSISGAKAAEARRDIISKITGPKGAIFVPIEVKPPLVKNINAIRKSIKDSLSGIVIEVEAKLKGGIAPAGATGVSGGEASQTKRPSFLDSPAYQAELNKIAKANAQALAKAAASLPSGRNRQEVERLLQAFQAQNPQGASRTSALGAIRDLIARGRYQQGLGFEASLQPLRGQRQTSAARSMPNLNEMLDRMANLTSNPRAAQRMLRALPESRITTDLVGAANRQAAFQQQFPQGFTLPGFNAPKAFDPLLKAIAKDFTDYARTVNISDPWVGQVSNGIMQVVAKAANSAQAQKLLPAAGQTSASRMTQQMFKGLPPITAPMIGAENIPLSRAAQYSLNKANRLLGLPIGPSSPLGSMGQFPISGMMGLGSMGQFPMDPMLAVDGASAMGQKIAGPYPWSNTLNSARGGYIRGISSSSRFPMSGMMGPSSPLGSITAQSSMFAGGGGGMQPPGGGGGGGGFGGAGGFGGFGGFGGAGGFGRAMGGVNLPGTGVIRELGEEFGFATKQVILFGQAYKLLAFIQNLPAQVGAAVGQLQSFRNTLNAVTPSAEEARASNELLLGLMEKYNVPLQSARDGFTKLYASMAPAGFSGDEIRDLFTGITKAAATFGMSADKVDRVNYAFAQMASKGQVMSEELKGQLGDVLPGAMALFAKAAGFEGPKAIQDFSAALEDGAYKGEAMVALLKNVTVVMNKEFGPGAEGAALTFQGVMNRMQNSMTLFYEAFEPVAVGFLNTVVVPMTNGIKQLTDGLNAFFTGTAAKTAGGFAIAQELERLRPAFDGIGQNVSAFVVQLGQLAKVALDVSKIFLQIAGNPIVGYLAKLYAIALPLNIALGVMRGLWASTALQLVIFNARVASGTTTLSAFRGMMAATGATSQATAASIRTAGTTLRAFFATTGVGLVVVGISMLIERFMTMNQALADTKAKAMGAAQAIRSMSQTEARLEGQKIARTTKELQSLQKSKEVFKLGGEEVVPVKGDAAKRLEEAGVGIRRDLLGRTFIPKTNITAEILRQEGLQAEVSTREKQIKFDEKQAQTPAVLGVIPPGEGDAKDAQKAKNDAEKLANQQQQRRIELANFANDMQKIEFDRDVQLSDAAFEHKKSLIDTLNEYELSGLNDIQARQVKFAQDLKKIQLNAVDAVRKALQKSQEAQLNVVAAQRTAQAAGGGGGPSVAGFTPAELSTATAAASKFTGIANMCSESVKAFYKSLGISLPGVTAWADTVRNAGTTMRDWSKLTPGDIVATGRPGDTPHVGVYTGGQNVFHQSRSRGLKAGNYPDLDYFKQGGYFVRPNGGMKQSSASFSMDTKVQKENFDLQKQLAQSTNQIALQSLEIERAIQLAKEQTAATIKANIDNIFPVEKQKLDLQLQQMRNNLILQGMPQEYIDYEEQRALKTEEAAAASSKMKDAINEAKVELGKYNTEAAKGIDLAPEQKARMKILEDQIAANEEGLKKLTDAQRQSNIASLESAIATMKQADALKAMEEVSGRIDDAVEGVTGTYKDMFKEIAKGGDSVEALKKAQEALADQALTMFFDFAMQPVEKFFKDQLGAIFGVPNEEQQRQKTISAMEAQLKELQAQKQIQTDIKNNTDRMVGAAPGGQQAQALPGAMPSAIVQGIDVPIDQMPAGMQFEESIGAATENLDTATQGVAETVNKTAEETTKANVNWQKALGATVQGIGIAAGSIMGIAAGINQTKEGGFANTLGGIGMIMSSVGGLLGGFSNIAGMFGGGGGASAIVQGVDIPASALPPGMAFANGGVAHGGFIPFRAFANGGTVAGPTLGLVGEGRYNEAIVPLPDGKSIPVQLGGRSARDLMGGNAPGMPATPALNMKFETTKINGVEYVSREQLEQAMASTRRLASREGAAQGSQLALNKLKNSPTTRRQLGL